MERNSQVTTAQLITKAIRGLNTIKSTGEGNINLLAEDIRKAVEELENIRRYFDVVEEPELIDYAIYREKAAIMKLSYLLKKAKCENNLLKSSNI
jgi:hypothetical protein